MEVKGKMEAMMRDLSDHSLPLERFLDTHFSPKYVQRTDGEWCDRQGFEKHAKHLRAYVSACKCTTLDELSDGRTYAERHIVEVDMKDGSKTVQEFYCFGELDEQGRFLRIEEVSHLLSGSEEDRDLGRAT